MILSKHGTSAFKYWVDNLANKVAKYSGAKNITQAAGERYQINIKFLS